MLKKVNRLDYFTLMVLIGLVELKNGSAVADKLHTTQSKVSRALNCLREVLDDELFIRQKYGFEPNSVALRIYPMAQSILEQYDKMISTTCNTVVAPYQLTVAAHEQWSMMVLNCVTHQCYCVEGGVNVHVLPWSDTVSEQLCLGKIDCSISIDPIRHEMVDDVNIGDITHFFLVARVGHPILTSTDPLTDMFDYKIGLVNSNWHNNKLHRIEEYAHEQGIKIRVALKSPSLRMVIDHASKSDDVCVLSSAVAYEYFEGREDVGFVDISAQWRDSIEQQPESYFLHCHRSVTPLLAKCMAKLLTEKLIDIQHHYESSQGLTPTIAKPGLSVLF